ncbi:Putative sugar transporter, major facilitator superfamily, MFS transporter superfamily [Colletotrichum destructivum]|uniref:Sugar transporter, major facilitator superfamily, MFS transporter superfamily n=1 Tax=Colletotrichum destructivum TaxID=34406 RepID=A0AAX4IHT4_9PEZI|nr:Putative sugar transporter, major facilitator superfamily, MFS transporter superfamily [Colletotrichum destructivum]
MSSPDEKGEKDAADALTAPPVSNIKQEANPALEVGVEAADSLLVKWDGDADPHHPFNWPRPRKWAITILLSNGGLVTLMSGAMLAPSLHAIAQDFGTAEEEAQIFLSIFVLAFAFGPMVLSPLAEVFGRRPVWILSSCFYILWNTVAGFSRTPGLMIASRVLSGIGASAEFAVTQPVLSDCWVPDERGKSYAIATFIPLLGPAIGPIIGGAVTQSIGWRWTFWILSIYDAVLVVIGFFILSETYEPILLSRQASKLSKGTGRPYFTDADRESQGLGVKLSRSLMRPLRLLLTQPILQVVAIFLAYNFGMLYIVLSTFATLWIQRYGQTESQSGFHYIALVIGYTIAAQVGGKVMDRLWRYLKARSGENTAPEYRVPLMVPGAVLIPLGLLLYGWTAERHTHWIVPDIGIGIFGCGIILNTQAMQAYVVEAFRKYVASASAAAQFLRSIAGFAFPIFAPVMYHTLGYGWGNSILALTFVVIGWPAPFLLWRYGARLRAMGKPQW